jgi:hypothetical protein
MKRIRYSRARLLMLSKVSAAPAMPTGFMGAVGSPVSWRG